MGDAIGIAEYDSSTPAYIRMPSDESRARRRADGVAAQVASQGLGADIYVTEREYLHSATWDLARGVVVCRPDEALPLVALYLRAQGAFLVAHGISMNRGLYYWVGTRELLHEGWRWSAALAQHAQTSGDERTFMIGMSVFQRYERALEARDHVHVALNQPQHNDTRREALARLDDVLVDLMGAVDATARVAHRVLGLPATDEHRAGWQRAWLRDVRRRAAPLAAFLETGTDACAALTVLRLLRNSVHGAALHAIALEERMRPQQSLVEVPPADQSEVLSAMSALGGEAAWGVRRLRAGAVHVDPGLFIDTLVPRVTELLNGVMQQTPLETLDGVSLNDADYLPPPSRGGSPGPWDEWQRLSIRWQLGF